MQEQPKTAPKKRISTLWFIVILAVIIGLCFWFAVGLGKFYTENIVPSRTPTATEEMALQPTETTEVTEVSDCTTDSHRSSAANRRRPHAAGAGRRSHS